MFKTLFKLVTVFGLLVGFYQGYVRAFAFVINRLTADRHVEQTPFEYHEPLSKLQSYELARLNLGKDHWATKRDVPTHFNAGRGIYLFAGSIAPPEGEEGARTDGKQLLLKPVAIILKTQGGSSTKVITSDEARLDFNKRLGFDAKPGAEPLIIKHARLEGNVVIRDDRGTPNDSADDMVVSMPWIEYDADKLQVQTDSGILLVDRDMRVTAVGLDILLRPKSDPTRPSGRAATGFEGAKSAVLRKNVNIVFGDVGSTGVLPGAAKTKKSADGKVAAEVNVDARLAQNKKPAADEAVPLNIQCDGPMQIDLPNPPLPEKVGPPPPPAPTLVRFNRNVVVKRGKLTELPDQLNCDTLDLTLLPGEKPAAKPEDAQLAKAPKPEKPAAPQGAAVAGAGANGDAEEKSLFGGLALRRAKASGHAVWLQMPSQNNKILCIELIHSKDPLTGKNTTHLLGGSRQLMFVKEDVALDGPDKGKVQSVTHAWCADATLMDDGDMDRGTLVANGPGRVEIRPTPKPGDGPPRETPPAQTAVWQDQLWLQNEVGPDGTVVGKIVVLKGMPRVQDRLQGASLDAAQSIVVWLDSKPSTAPKTATTLDSREVVPAAYTAADPASPSAAPGAGGMNIRRLLAVKDVHMVAPSQDLRARDRLDVDFEQAKITATPPTPAPASNPAPAPAAAPGSEAPAPAPAQSAAPAPKPLEPLMTALADRVQAKVIVGAKPPATSGKAAPASPIPGGSNSSYEIRDVEMRGGVVLHQDPAPDKKKGTDASGEVLVLRNEASGKAVFDLYHHDPYSPKTQNVKPETMPPARVVTEEMTIEANLIGVNQSTNKAWAYGAGKLTQLTDRGLMTDRSPDAPNQADAQAGDSKTLVVEKTKKRAGKVKAEKTKITITWADKMTFEGVAVDPLNRPAAKAVFYKNARAEMEDSVLYGGESITTYTDQPIPLAEFGKLTQKPKPAPTAANDEDLPAVEDEKPKPDLALLECKGNAVAITRKVDPDRPVLLSLQKLAANSLTYDRRSGGFIAPGPGMVYLYDRNNNDPTKSSKPSAAVNETATSRRTIQQTSFQSDGDDKIAVRNGGPAAAAAGRAADPKSLLPPLVLTQIKFNKEMRGRFGTGKQDDVTEQRWAEFFGGVETARCEVPSVLKDGLNYDHLPANAYFLTSETLRVITEPPPAGSERNAPSRNFLKAWDNATVVAKDTTLQADVITYDSLNDLIYANALEGRTVQAVQQTGLGQPGSPLTAKAVRMNPKTGAVDVADPANIQLIDHHTGERPKTINMSDPEPGTKAGKLAKPKEPRKPPKRPTMNQIEKKGFTGR
ncbi:MAG: hypothetical protein P4L85_28985 [Paludisphaera borealis]|uniref:hypothetical protein n=1 Tax=Paludisphaera borealis TaxID=1387353 RepID=UPI002841CB29|nr:hypothetical protein [Paludisphaera borealis]MDR3623403.1 hypothetical protein [Paludisphaera borealis]